MDIECESAIPEKDAIEKREFYSFTFLIAELSRVRDRKVYLSRRIQKVTESKHVSNMFPFLFHVEVNTWKDEFFV